MPSFNVEFNEANSVAGAVDVNLVVDDGTVVDIYGSTESVQIYEM